MLRGVDVQFDLDAIGEVLARLVDHHVPAGHQEQAFAALEEKAAGVGQQPLSFESDHPRRGQQQRISGRYRVSFSGMTHCAPAAKCDNTVHVDKHNDTTDSLFGADAQEAPAALAAALAPPAAAGHFDELRGGQSAAARVAALRRPLGPLLRESRAAKASPISTAAPSTCSGRCATTASPTTSMPMPTARSGPGRWTCSR